MSGPGRTYASYLSDLSDPSDQYFRKMSLNVSTGSKLSG